MVQVQIKAGDITTITVHEPAHTDTLVQFIVDASDGTPGAKISKIIRVVLTPEASEILETALRVARQKIMKGRR
jgi:hypothetical protein